MKARRLAVSLLAISQCFVLAANARVPEWLDRLLSRPAVDYGYWLCSNCSLPAPYEPANTTSAPADINMFVSDNNPDIHDSKNEKIHRWTPGSSITVCNSQNVCMTVYYQSGTKLWMPRLPTYPKPPNVQPKVPKNPEVSNLQQNWIGVDSVDSFPDPFGGSWMIEIPYLPPKQGSVTVIQQQNSTMYIGPSYEMDFIINDIGSTLNWNDDAAGLAGPGTGGCGAPGDPYCVPAGTTPQTE